MKKVFALFLALVMSLALVACSGGGEDIPEKPEGPITISVSVAQTGDGFTVLAEAAEAFNNSQSDYVVDLYYGGSYTEIMTIMQTSTEADRPDIFASSGNDTALYIAMEDKMYIPVQDFIDAEKYDDSTIVASLRANYQRNGEWQCWPLGNTSVGQYYNTEVLASLGIDASALASYQEIYDACKTIAAAGYKNFYYLRALNHIDWLNYALTAQGVEYFDNSNGRDGVPTKCLFDEGDCYNAVLAFFQFLRDMVDQGDWLLDPTISSTDAWVSFAAQDVLIMDGYVSGANSIVSLVADSGKPFEWSYEVSPTIEAGKPTKGQSPGGGALFIANTGNYWKQQGAWEFMKFLMTDEVVSDYAMATGYIPVTTTGAETEEYKDYIANTFPSAATTIAAMAATEDGIAYAPVPFSSSVNTAYKEICQEILNDPSYTAEDAVAELTQKTNEAIELYRLTEGLD